MRCGIQQKLQESTTVALASNDLTLSSTVMDHWKEGELTQIADLSEAQIVNASTDELFMISNAYIDLGKFDSAQQLVDLLGQRGTLQTTPGMYSMALTNVLNAVIKMYTNEPIAARQSLNNALRFGELTNNRFVLGLANLYMGELLRIQDNNLQAIVALEKALEYLDIVNFPFVIVQIYLSLSNIYAVQLKPEQALHYLHLCGQVLAKYPNSHYWGDYYHVKSYLDYFSVNNPTVAEVSAKQGVEINTNTSTSLFLAQSYEMLAEINTFGGSEDAGYHLSQQVRNVTKFMPHCVHLSELIELFITAKHDYKTAIQRATDLCDSAPEMIKPNSKRFLLFATEFLRAPDENTRKLGERHLVELMNKTTNGIIQRACRVTLESKALRVI